MLDTEFDRRQKMLMAYKFAEGWYPMTQPFKATELLYALKEAKAELRDLGPDHPSMRVINAAIAKVDAAIAKAKGGHALIWGHTPRPVDPAQHLQRNKT